MNVQDAPIGIFDSGLGGLSVAREIRSLLPLEHVLYSADSAYCPYGTRPVEFIRARTLTLTGELVDRGCKVLVLACNTACAAALDDVRAAVSIPVIGLEPAVKPAALRTRTGRIGVLATPRTAQSERLRDLIDRYRGDADVIITPSPGLVELVERGQTVGSEVESEIRALTDPLLESGIDVLVLGCTHYPFLRSAIQAAVGSDVAVLDSGEAIARRTLAVLEEQGLRRDAGSGSFRLTTTGVVADVAAMARQLLGDQMPLIDTTLAAAG